MTFENYSHIPEDFTDNITSYEEQLLLNYDDYLEGGFSNAMAVHNHYNLELEDLEDDFESEYDENDWEEEDPNENLSGEYDENEEQPGTFEMIN